MILALLALLAAAFGGGKSSAGGSVSSWQPPDQHGLNMLRELGERAGLTDLQIAFLAFVAYGESRINNLVGLGIPSMYPEGTKPNVKASAKLQNGEAAAARKAYERNAHLFAGCGHPASHYQFGSGGWFAFLPANALAQLKNTELVCLSPFMVFDPIASLVMAYQFARSLQGWDGFGKQPTVLNLRAMWGYPSKGGDSSYLASKRPKYEKHLAALGLPKSFLDTKLPRFPKRDLVAMFQQLEQGWAVA